jgi:hypothetical protein
MSPVRKFETKDEALKARQSLFPYRQLMPFDIDTVDQYRVIEIDGEKHFARLKHGSTPVLQISNCRQRRPRHRLARSNECSKKRR